MSVARDANDEKANELPLGRKRHGKHERLSLRALRLFPFVLVGGAILGGLALFAHETMTAAASALEKCRAGDSGRCVELMRAWNAIPSKRREGWLLGTERCLTGMYAACDELVVLAKNGAPTEPPPVEETLELGCERGHEALCTLRGIHSMGIDESEARAWFLRACRQEDSNACTRLGEWILEGRSGPKDRAEGLRYLDLACGLQPRDPGDDDRISAPCARLVREKHAGKTAR